jgi:hypothetical protein
MSILLYIYFLKKERINKKMKEFLLIINNKKGHQEYFNYI